MVRNYNGNVNRAVIRALRKICDVNAENERNLFKAFAQSGRVLVYENNDPFTGFHDEMSTVVELKTEAEIKECLKKDLAKRMNKYLGHRKQDKDYLLTDLIEFIKKNNRFPKKDEMKQLEKNAEAKRIAELPSDTIIVPKEITEQDLAREIIELSEEIMESRRESNPDDILVRRDSNTETYMIETEELNGIILHEVYGSDDFHDYRCVIRLKKQQHDVKNISICYCHRHDNEVYVAAKNFFDEEIHISVTKYLLAIHAEIVKIAKSVGFEFKSEIDYEKFQVA